MKFLSRVNVLRLCVLMLPLSAGAEIRLPRLLSDHAVLQRERPIHLWGWATPGASIKAQFHGQTAFAEADELGKWSMALSPEAAGGPYVLTLEGDGATKTVSDLLVGDVWLASGQSNMEMPLAGFPPTAVIKDSAKEIAAANNPRLRLMLVEHKTSDYPLNDVSATWTTCTPETAKSFSAVAYFFGREIAAKENVPIGLIDSTWGGTPADSWVSFDTLGTHPELQPAFASRAAFEDGIADKDAVIAADKRADDADKAAGKPVPSHPWHPFPASWQPAALYNGMIAPLTPYTVRGFLWYQGETNSAPDRVPYYDALMTGLIGDWRGHFAQGNLPFLYVQISSFSSPGENWGMLRDQQRRTLAVNNTAMAVTLDVGKADNVHPPDKQTVAERLAAAARATVYGERLKWGSPVYLEATPERKADGTAGLRVWFDHAEGLRLTGGSSGFELAGPDHHFAPAEAVVQGGSVLVTAKNVAHPVYVRYGWAGVVDQYLYNGNGDPASTFTSERAPVVR